jgi:hypothetical protein
VKRYNVTCFLGGWYWGRGWWLGSRDTMRFFQTGELFARKHPLGPCLGQAAREVCGRGPREVIFEVSQVRFVQSSLGAISQTHNFSFSTKYDVHLRPVQKKSKRRKQNTCDNSYLWVIWGLGHFSRNGWRLNSVWKTGRKCLHLGCISFKNQKLLS